MQKNHIHHVIEDAVRQFTENARSRGINIKIKKNVRELPPVEFDRENMFMVFINLVENAVKYSNDNKDIRIGGEITGNRIKIDVTNYGLGVLPENKERIFELYTRGTLRHNKKFVQGTGIGLWVVNQIVKAHGGDVTVWSSLFDYPELASKKEEAAKRGARTTFTIELPL